MKRLFVLVWIVSLLAACQSSDLNQVVTPKTTIALGDANGASYAASKLQRRQRFKQKVLQKQKKPQGYTIVLESMSKNAATSTSPFSVQRQIRDFKTQSTASETVFEDILVLTGSEQLFERRLDLSNDQKHRFVFENFQPGIQIQIKLNGQTLQLEETENKQALMSVGVPVLEQNTVQITVQGQFQSNLTFSVLQGEDVGVVLRSRKETLLSSSELQNIQKWDSSYGDIRHLNGGESVQISRTRLDDTEVFFQTGVVQAEFESQLAREQFESLYGAQVLDEIRIGDDVVYLMSLDLQRAPLEQVFNLLNTYNQGLPVDISAVNFSSVAAMQTVVLMLDAMTQHPEWLKGLSFNQMAQGGQTQPPDLPVYVPDLIFDPFFYDNSFPWQNYQFPQSLQTYQDRFKKLFIYGLPKVLTPLSSQQSSVQVHYNWSLIESVVLNSWNYSLGTGVTVAWLDQNARLLHPELKRRFVSTSHNPTQESCFTCRLVTEANSIGKGWTPAMNRADAEGQAEHGHYSMMVGFAEKDNGIVSAGVAPNAKVMPFSVTLSWDAARALGSIRKNNLDVDIIGTAVGWNYIEYLALYAPEKIMSAFLGNLGLEKELLDLGERDTIFVNHAGNLSTSNDSDSWERQYVPSLQLPHVLSVSNADISTFTTASISSITGHPKRFLIDNQASNYYRNQESFWAPGTDIPVAPHHLLSNAFQPVPVIFTGTSAASPFMTGVIALMKSRNPDLTPAQIKSILRVTSRPLDYTNKPDLNLGNTHFVNALEAVKMAIRMKYLRAEDFHAKAYYGLVGSEPGSLVLHLNEKLNPNAQSHEKKKRLVQSVSDQEWAKLQPGAFVKVIGWSGVPTGTSQIADNALEVLRVEPVRPLDLNILSRDCLKVAGVCLNYSNVYPFINQVSFNTSTPSFADGFTLTLSGKNLFANLSLNNSTTPFVLELQNTSSNQNIPIAITPENILSISNQGDVLKVKVPVQLIAKDLYNAY